MNSASVSCPSSLEAKVSETRARVAVCIGTFRRRELLRNLLAGLACLTFRGVSPPEIEIIVIDNDPSASAKEICESVTLPHSIRYVVEPRRGIAYVRNRALAEAKGANFIAFIDDDEVPSEGWLDELLVASEIFAADIVSGPVLPRYAPGVAEWVKRGGFFDRPNFDTGTFLECCSTNNVLLRSEVLNVVPRFDDRFQLTGGEDTQFFSRVHRAGGKIVWCREAIAHETVPKERATLEWILRRGYQSGNSWVLSEMSVNKGLRVQMKRLLKACAHMLIGGTNALLSVCFAKIAFTKALRRMCLGAGMLSGLAGRKFLAYRSTAAADGIDSSPEFVEHVSP